MKHKTSPLPASDRFQRVIVQVHFRSCQGQRVIRDVTKGVDRTCFLYIVLLHVTMGMALAGMLGRD